MPRNFNWKRAGRRIRDQGDGFAGADVVKATVLRRPMRTRRAVWPKLQLSKHKASHCEAMRVKAESFKQYNEALSSK